MNPKIPEKMLAAVYHGKNDVRLETIPVPAISKGELLVKVAYCGVCPTDLKKIHAGTLAGPRVFGHETAGVIVKVGRSLSGFAVGDRVALHHHVPCQACDYCRHRAFAQCETYKRTGITAGFEPAGGGYAQYVRVMDFVLPGVIGVPKRNGLDEATMVEPVNTVLKAVEKLELLRGDKVLVIGQGPIGLIFTKLLQIFGMHVVAADILEDRLLLARSFGAQNVFNPQNQEIGTLRKQLGNYGADAIVLAVPLNTALQDYWNLLRGGGKFLLFAHTLKPTAFPIDLGSVCVDEKDLIGSYSSDFNLQAKAASLIFSRKLDVRKLLRNIYPLKTINTAFEKASRPSSETLKVIVKLEHRDF